MSMQARPIARAQLRAQHARPAVRPACMARQQLARVGRPGLAALQRGLQTSRAAPCSRGRRAVVTEAAKKSVGDLSKADLEGKVVLVRTHPARQGAKCAAGLPSYPRARTRPDVLFATYGCIGATNAHAGACISGAVHAALLACTSPAGRDVCIDDHAELRFQCACCGKPEVQLERDDTLPIIARCKCPCKAAEVLDAQPWPPHHRHGRHGSLLERGSCTAAETTCAVHRCART